MKFFRIVLLSVCATTLLAGCESAKEQMGLNRSSPDEFAVVKRAPLEMPPDYNLRPPQPGAPRPQEQAMSEQARSAVLGERPAPIAQNGYTKGEAAFLDSFNATYNPDIRDIVNEEATRTERKNEPVVKKIFNMGRDTVPAATIVDSRAEAERLKRNAEEGKPVTEGKTPTIED